MKKLLVIVFISLTVSACVSTSTPVSTVTVSGDGLTLKKDSSLESYSINNRQEITEEPLSSERSVPPVVSSLLRKSDEAVEQGEWSKAEVLLQRAMRIAPKNAVLWNKMAGVKLQQGKFTQAVQFAKKSNSVSSDPLLQAKNERILELASKR